MSWKSDLKKIDVLAEELGIVDGLTSLNYHLHQSWQIEDADYAIGGEACGADNTGGHYDPFFAVSLESPVFGCIHISLIADNLCCVSLTVRPCQRC